MVPSSRVSAAEQAAKDQFLPDRKLPDLTVIIPAYKEAEALDLLLPILKQNVAALTKAYEILVIDTEAKLDDTEQVCRAYGVTHIRRLGEFYGDAVRSGISHARGGHILFMDADGSHNPGDIEKLWAKRTGYDLVIGSRYVAGGHTDNPRVLIFMSYVVNVIFRLVFGLKCRDVSNSFRLYRAAVLKELHIASDNFDVLPEVLIKICRQFGANSVLEVPITFEKRKRGESKRDLVSFAFTYLMTIIRLKRITNSSALSERASTTPTQSNKTSAGK
jgi:dolichol-phosphate mannosyltransferase